MISLESLADKLRKYREQLQESIDDVSKATGIPVDRLRTIEAARIEPTGDEILIISDHYRCDYKFFVSNDQVAAYEQTATLYRAHVKDFSKADRRAIQEFLYLCETEAYLMKELRVPVKEFTYKPTVQSFKRDGEAAAAAMRRWLGHSDREVARDVYDEFRSVGVHVFRRKLGNSSISGLFVLHPTAGKCALINASEDIYRQRFSAAHEIAHAIFDSDQQVSVSYVRSNASDYREVRANRFASCYLIPPALLKKLSTVQWDKENVLHWASKLRVSCIALGVALKQAKMITYEDYKAIKQLRIPKEQKIDPELPATLTQMQRDRKAALLDLGLSDSYVQLCFDATKQGVISVGRLAEALLCGQAELLELADIYGVSLHGN